MVEEQRKNIETPTAQSSEWLRSHNNYAGAPCEGKGVGL